MTEIPVYRLALEDKSHPMHNIAKDVFRKKFDANAVAQKYADQRNVFDRMTDDFDIITVAECLMVNNPDRAKKFLRKRSKTSRYRRFRSDFEKIIAKFKRGAWD